MTNAQQEAWTKSTELLKEHFDTFVLIIDTEAPENLDRLFDAMWHGGGSTVGIGLCERAKHRMLSRSNISDPSG